MAYKFVAVSHMGAGRMPSNMPMSWESVPYLYNINTLIGFIHTQYLNLLKLYYDKRVVIIRRFSHIQILMYINVPTTEISQMHINILTDSVKIICANNIICTLFRWLSQYYAQCGRIVTTPYEICSRFALHLPHTLQMLCDVILNFIFLLDCKVN